MTQVTRNPLSLLLVATMALALGASQSSAFELNRTFSDDMVLQRDKPVNVWGTGKAGEKVTVTFAPRQGSGQAGQTVKATTGKDGRWIATLKPMPASSEAGVISVQSSVISKPIEIKNVVVGDVFLFARQTSIDVSLGKTEEGKKAAAAAKGLRFIRINTSPSRTPLNNLNEDATTGWKVVDKKSALDMSAAAFYLARDLTKDVDVPLGIVDLNMGYHFGVAWLSEQGVKTAMQGESMGAGTVGQTVSELKKNIEIWDKKLDGYVITKRTKRSIQWAKADGPVERPIGFSPIEIPQSPSVCYNSVIHPLRGLVVRGMLLQLGNDYPYVAFTRLRDMGKSTDLNWLGNAAGITYNVNKKGNQITPAVLPVVVDDLRRSLGDDSVPLAWIMPTGSDVYEYGLHNREVREVQRRAQAKTKGVDLILPGAENMPLSGQPADEALVGTRCTQWARSTFYGAKGPATGPLFDRVEFEDDKATVFFKKGTAEGLTADGDALKHFELADGDREFVPCKAEIVGSCIKLTSDTVENPMYARFGWVHKPVQGLVNGAGLPALPFNANKEWEYNWWPDPEPVELPAEYSLPANKWPKRNYAIINYATEGGGRHLGPTGLWGTEAGPNLYITRITSGSPADGKVLVGDMIYGVNGTEFRPGEDEKFHQFTTAIGKAEAEKGGGTMVLNIRREGKLIKVPIELEYMGSFSDTTPWNCEKSENIVKKAEEYMRKGLRPKTGFVNESDYMYGPWNDNVIFLLASGNPKMQGLVRRYIRRTMDQLDVTKRGGKFGKGAFNSYGGWGSGYMKMLLGEYYHRTGDAAVLPYLEYLVKEGQKGEVEQYKANPGSWPPTEPSGYGTHPAGQMVGTMGVVLAREAGIKVHPQVLARAVDSLYHKRAEFGYILYNGYGKFTIESRQLAKLVPLDSRKKASGHVISMNGKLGTGAALFSMLDGYETAVTNCSERCVYAFNHTRKGHGGAWFNNFWTPIGAYHAGKEKYQHFMRGQQWWRDLYRDHTGAMWQEHNAKEKKSVLATGFVSHRVAHHKRLRMFGAPRSAFAANPPAYLKEALVAHRNRDYALAETLVQKILKKGGIPESELPMVEHFLDSVQMVKESVAYDLDYTEDAIKRGELYLANLELPQLKMVVKPDNPRLKAIAAAIESEKGKAQLAAAEKAARDAQSSAREAHGAAKNQSKANWARELAVIDTIVKDGEAYNGLAHRTTYPSFPKEEWNRWRVNVLETVEHSPEGWAKPGFDDSRWGQMLPPLKWITAHTGLLRTTFEVKDKRVYRALQVRANAYKQNNLQVYLNGELVAKVNNIPRSGKIDFALTDYAMEILKNGENTLAVSAEHGKRWVDFSLRLEGRLKEKKDLGVSP